jgi:hypothetical protein
MRRVSVSTAPTSQCPTPADGGGRELAIRLHLIARSLFFDTRKNLEPHEHVLIVEQQNKAMLGYIYGLSLFAAVDNLHCPPRLFVSYRT